jgi:hypothetical protein
MTWHKSEAVRTGTERRITGRRFRGLDEVVELGGVSALDVALASGSELQLVLRLALLLRLRCTIPTQSLYKKNNLRWR